MGVARHARLKQGDVLEVQSLLGFAYLQYIGKHKLLGDTIYVRPQIYPGPTTDLASVLENSGYVAFYPANLSVKEGLTRVVASHRLSVDVPSALRRPGAITRNGTIVTWLVDRDGTTTVHKALSEADRQLPIGEAWSHELLLTRLAKGWRPEQNVETGSWDDDKPGSASSAPSMPALQSAGQRLRIHHYLYFPTKRAATTVASRARSYSHEAECRLGADGENWLVLVTVEVVGDDARKARLELERLAKEFKGDYDGCESEIMERKQGE